MQNSSFLSFSNILKFSLGISLLAGNALMADITILEDWTIVQDPPHPGFTGSPTNPSTAQLFAGNQAIPNATDIGFQSFDGTSAATSTNGFAFNPSSDFLVAIDYDLAFPSSSVGGLGLGFGIGETSDGANSAGGALLSVNGNPTAIGTFARVDDVNQPGSSNFIFALSGSINVSYVASSGDITIGFASTDSETSFFSGTFSGIQNNWNDELLMVSFFIRSDSSISSAWTSGESEATFSNMRVLSGSPVAVPEPTTYTLFALLASASFVFFRRRSV